MKVCLFPRFQGADRADGGIRRVVEALLRYLPEYGVEFVEQAEEADLSHCHAGNIADPPGVPMISSNHGMYWSEYEFGQMGGESWSDDANAQIVLALSVAKAVTAPSEWVANALRRGMLVDPQVIYHGVEADEWQPTTYPQDYVLWNKARADSVSNPGDCEELARRCPEFRFLSTLGRPAENLSVVGVVPAPAMKLLVENAGLYLATARETFGIGTLEAMAAGVPIVGWAYGGQREIVRQGETGYLAPPGDFEALRECLRRARAERARLSAHCVADVRERWGWRPRIEEYYALYQRVVNGERERRPKVSVIVPIYNLEKYLEDTLRSLWAQTLSDFEVLMVDDCSTDGSAAIARAWEARDPRFRYVRADENGGLCRTRNLGLRRARGRYLCFVDGDDLLTPVALAAQATLLDNEPGIHITYGHLDVTNEDGSEVRRNDWPFKEFSWYGQMAHLNMIPATALVRREVFERAGGFRARHWRAEDAWYWSYVTSFGFYAERATDATTHVWRSRAQNKSKGEGGDGDWTAEFPWAIAHSAQEAMDILRDEGQFRLPNADSVPFGAQGPMTQGYFWRVPHREDPAVTIAVLTGEEWDEDRLIDTLDSLNLQPFGAWECVVVNETGRPGPRRIPGALWVNIIEREPDESAEAAARRVSRAPRLILLQAGDTLEHGDLERICRPQE